MDSVTSMQAPQTEEQLEELLSRPYPADVEGMSRLKGDIVILGAGGKMGPSLALRAKRATDEAGVARRILAVSRFSSLAARDQLERRGVQTLVCDFLDRDQVGRLPDCENVLYLAGRKFGTGDRSDLTWASNTIAPANIALRFQKSRLVVFSTGNVYPFVAANGPGSVETDAPDPVGDYAQSCLGRERVIEYFSREFGTPCLMFRLNYAVDLRYGVLVDVAWKVRNSSPIDLTVGYANVIWQGDANSLALRSLSLCQSPPRILNITGTEKLSVRDAAAWFARRWRKEVRFQSEEGTTALLSDPSLSCSLLGEPEISAEKLMQWVAQWVESGGSYLGKPTKYEVSDGKF
jgi:nucleoside-diphosphate-sugar epimerase